MDEAKCMELTLARARAVQGILKTEAKCSNMIAARGLGYADEKGGRCELTLCSDVEAEHIEATSSTPAKSREVSDAPLRQGFGRGPSLKINFMDNGDMKTIVFTQLPLGIAFDKGTPARITDVESGSHAEQLGVQRGWTFKSISGQDVAGKDFRAFMAFLKAGQAELAKGSKADSTLQVYHILRKHQDSSKPVSHRTGKSTEHVARSEANKVLEAILARLAAHRGQHLSEAFQEEAKAHSDCGSYKRGGDLGLFRVGDMQVVFEKAALALPLGGLSGVVESDSGSHIILRVR